MAIAARQDGWELVEVEPDDLDQLMSWFDDALAVKVWGGPRFRYPFTAESFRDDCHWGRMASYRLDSPGGEFAAFGQLYKRYGRINLARLIAHPEKRGQGVGTRLVSCLLEAGPQLIDSDEFSLFVYRDNAPALQCYQAMDFVIRDYPEGASMADECYYLTRPVFSTTTE